MKIQLKRSNVLSGGSAKEPTGAQMEYGEIAVNYNESDPVLFIKDSSDNIVRIAGANSSGGFDGDYESLTNKPTIGDGTITIKNSDGSDNASFSVNQTGPTEITLPAGFSGDYDDLTNQPTIGDGTITIKSGGVEVGTFTVNQEGTTDIDIPVASWGDVTEKPIYIDTNTPGSPNNGDLWVDLNECPPELKIWSDCSGTGQWEGIEGTPDLVTLTPTLSGNPSQGEVLTSTEGQAVGGKPPFTFTYDFKDQNNNVLQSSAARTYTLLAGDIGKTVTVTVTALDARGTSDTSDDSNAIGPIVPPESVNAPTLLTPASGSIDLSVDSITLTCSAYSGVQSIHGTTTWQISAASDFSSFVYNVPNTNETTNVATFSTPLNYDSIYYARCRHTSSNGISSDFSNVNTFTTEVDPNSPDFPNADMSGLRFDSARQTYLSRGFSSAGSATTWTFSCWTKITAGQQSYFLQSRNGSNVTDGNIGISASGHLRIVTGVTDAFVGDTALPVNEWLHIVVSFDTTNPTASERVKYYVNGQVPAGTYQAPAQNAQFGIGSAATHAIGRHAGNKSDYLDGYLSDVYFTNAAVVEPTAFGKEFPDGRWGPLDSSIITENINNAVVSPYDERANTDQVWSNSGDDTNVSFGTTWAMGFDGDSTSHVVSSENTTISWDYGSKLGTNATLYIRRQASATITLTINGSTTNAQGVDWDTLVPANDQVTALNIGDGIQSFSLTRNGGGNSGFYFNALEVDGRQLVDQGVWNTSQNWSENLSGGVGTDAENSNPASAFDGNLSTFYRGGANTPITFDCTGLGLSGDVEIAAISGGTFTYNINDGANTGSLATNTGSPAAFASTGHTGAVTKIEVTSSVGSYNLAGFKVGGVVLVDEGAQWNTSQVWSDNITADNIGQNYNGVNNVPSYITDIFNGDTAIGLYPVANTVSNIDLTELSSPSGTFEIYLGLNGNQSATGVTYNGNQAIAGLGPAGWYTLPVTPNSIEVANTSGNFQYGLHAIRVAGVILVDPGSFGTNGFYLPFDPTATGVTYSGASTSNAPTVMFEDSAGALFNGDTNTGIKWEGTGSSASNSITLQLTTPITTKDGKIKCIYNGTGTQRTIQFNSEAPQTFIVGSGGSYRTGELVAPASISSITCADAGGQGASARITGLYDIDDNLLIDYNSIGVDASGQGNNFHDQNFGVGNTSQVWSNGISLSTGSYAGDGPLEGFSGDITKNYATSVAGATITIDFPEALSGEFEWVSKGAQTQNVTLVHAGGTETQNNVSLTAQTFKGLGTFTGITQFTLTNSNPGESTGFSGIRVAGEFLIDKNNQDTVTDTPLKSYAVLAEGSNGNLVNEPSSTTSMSTIVATSFPIYAEFTVLADANSNSEQLTVRNSSNTQIQALQVPDAKAGDVYGIAITETTRQWYKNGATNGGEEALDTSNGIKLGAYNTGSVSKFAANFGQQPFIYPQAGYEGLYQTWNEWATFGLFVYDANQGKAIRTFELNKTYGIRDVLTAANIFRLTAQPRYKVISYIENNGEYSALEDVSEQLIAANATISSLQSELDTTQAELDTASASIATNLTARAAIEVDVDAILARLSGLESDEIVDDATDTTLLTAFAALVARVEALENP